MPEPLERDARLADGLRAPAGPPAGPPAHILLTGVTGFLGGQIAADLLRSTGARLYCPVRDKAGVSAARRLASLNLDPARVTLLEGAPPAQVDTVVHCAAAVNLFAPYAALRDSNVLGALAVLEYAATGRPKTIHHLSTAGVFLSPEYRGRTVTEDGPVLGAGGLRNGYAQSKWVADTMMTRARDRGFAAHVYRPTFVGWHTRTGRPGPADLVVLLLRASAAAGCAPALDLQINSTPVDHVAAVVASLVATPPAEAGTYHIANRVAVRFTDLAAMAGHPVVAPDVWEAAVRRAAPRYARFAAKVAAAGDDGEELRFAYDRTYDDRRLRHALGPARPAPGPLDRRYLEVLSHP